MHLGGIPRDPKSVQCLAAWSLISPGGSSPVAGAGHPPSAWQDSAPGSAWGKPTVALCATRRGTGTAEEPSGDRCFGTWQGAAPWVLCSLALSSDQQESTVRQLGLVLAFLCGPSLHLAQECASGPSGEQTLSSGLLPFEAFQKGKGVLKTEKVLYILLLVNKNAMLGEPSVGSS